MSISNQSVSMWRLNFDYIEHIKNSRSDILIGSSLHKAINMNIILLCCSLLEGFLNHYVEQETIKHYIAFSHSQNFMVTRMLDDYLNERWKGEVIKNAIKKIEIFKGIDLNDTIVNPHAPAINSISIIRNIIAHGGTVTLTPNEKRQNLFIFNNGKIAEVLQQSGVISGSQANNIQESDLDAIMGALFSDALADYFIDESFSFIRLVDRLGYSQ